MMAHKGGNMVKLIDCGISKDLSALVDLTRTINNPSDTDKLRVTLRYMAPELRDGVIREASKDTDMWSAGVVAAELLFGLAALSRNAEAMAPASQQPPVSAADIIPSGLPLELLIPDEGITEEEMKAALNLVNRMLVVVTNAPTEDGEASAAVAVARLTATEALLHPFFTKFNGASSTTNGQDTSTCTVCQDNRVNRVLRCGHTICSDCELQLIMEPPEYDYFDDDELIECPSCR
jgi:serine/threonine protein kinase